MSKVFVWVGCALAALQAWGQDIVIGQSVPLSGSNAEIGRDMRDGALGRLDLKGSTVNFGPNQHHGSNGVELTILSRDNRFVQ